MIALPYGMALLLLALCGLCLGSFATVLADRLPQGQSIAGRSRCPACRRTLTCIDLIPVVSFLMLLGRCRRCRSPIPPWYPALEIASALVFIMPSTLAHAVTVMTVLLGVAFWLLLVIAVADATAQMVSDSLAFPFILFAAFTAWTNPTFSFAAPLLLAAFFGAQWVCTRGRWVGSADILIAAGIGVLLGTLAASVLAIFIAYIAGAIVATVLLVKGRASRDSRIAFVPFLAFGTIVSFLWSEQILQFFGL